MTTDDVVEALTICPGDLVHLRENFSPMKNWGLGIVLAAMPEESTVTVMWPESAPMRLSRCSRTFIAKLNCENIVGAMSLPLWRETKIG